MKNKKLTYLLYFILFTIAGLAYFGYLFFSFAQVPINSDYATQILQAKDILSGNILLKGWNLSTAADIFTDLPYYVIGNLIFGVSTPSYIFASTLMLFLMVCAVMLLLPKDIKIRITLLFLLLFSALTAFPNPYHLSRLRGHVAMYTLMFLLVSLAEKIYAQSDQPSKKRRTNILFITLLAIGTAGDLFIVPIFSAAIVLLCVFFYIAQDIENLKRMKALIFLTVVGTILGKGLEMGYFALSDANFSSLSSLVTFTPISQISSTFTQLSSLLLQVFGADFSDMRIFSPQAVMMGLRMITFLFGLWVLFSAIIAIFKKREFDFVTCLLGTGMIINVLWLIFSPLLRIHDPLTGRYVSYFPFAFAIILLRHLNEKKIFTQKVPLTKIPAILPLLLVSALFLLTSIQPIRTTRIPTPQDRLATFLRDHQLIHGYSDFWTANHVVVASKNEVFPRAISFAPYENTRYARSYRWLSKDEWYNRSDANFVIAKTDGEYANYHNLRPDVIVNFFGKPKRILTFEDYKIFIYDPDRLKIAIER